MLTDKQKIFLAMSPEFQTVLDEDPVLKQLDDFRIDYNRERELLREAYGATWKVAGDIPVAPVTPAVWSVLWAMKSPFVRKPPVSVKIIDVAIFLYLLTHDLSDVYFSTLEEDAKKEGAAFGLPEDAETLALELHHLVDLALAPLKMLPSTGCESADDPVYDADWLLSVCSVASREAGIPLQRVMVDLPLSVVYSLLVVRARKTHPDKHYAKRSPEWVSKKELERVNELSEAFVREHYKEG